MSKYSKLFFYDEFIEKMYENVLSDEELSKYSNFYDHYQDFDTLKDIRKELVNIKNSLVDVDYNDIKISKLKKIPYGHKCEIIGYTKNIDFKLIRLKDLIQRIEDEEIQEDFRDLYNNILPDINIEKENFNRIHIIEGLPEGLKGIDLGYKIYKALLKKFNYLSSDSRDVSYSAKGVWNKLRKDTDYYTFLKDKKVLCVEINYKEIFKLLEKFYYKNILNSDNSNILLDPDFLKNNDVKNTLLKNII